MKLRLDSGEDATATAIDDNILTILSPRAYAPGSPIHFSAMADEGSRSLEGRTVGSRRAGAEGFEVRLRLVNLRRAERDFLLRELA